MTRAHEPAAPASAVVTDLDEARRRRATATAGTTGAPAPAATAGPATDGPPASAPPKRRRDPANRRFDAVKVARLKLEIAEGRYEIDPWSVADRFIEHERNRG